MKDKTPTLTIDNKQLGIFLDIVYNLLHNDYTGCLPDRMAIDVSPPRDPEGGNYVVRLSVAIPTGLVVFTIDVDSRLKAVEYHADMTYECFEKFREYVNHTSAESNELFIGVGYDTLQYGTLQYGSREFELEPRAEGMPPAHKIWGLNAGTSLDKVTSISRVHVENSPKIQKMLELIGDEKPIDFTLKDSGRFSISDGGMGLELILAGGTQACGAEVEMMHDMGRKRRIRFSTHLLMLVTGVLASHSLPYYFYIEEDDNMPSQIRYGAITYYIAPIAF